MTIKLYQTAQLEKREVENSSGENLGSINRLIIDLETGQITFAILRSGGFPSRKKYLAVPWDLLKFSVSAGKVVLNISKTTIDGESGYGNIGQVLENLDTRWLNGVYRDYQNQTGRKQFRETEIQNKLEDLETKRDILACRSSVYFWRRDQMRKKMIGN
jgi:sporulation protein YlmC with PRC-barrel domain